MPDIVLHLGAHRTGTTSLQKFLERHEQLIHDDNIQLIFPPKSRDHRLRKLIPKMHRVFVSEENMLGTMEENLKKAELYPNTISNLARYSTWSDKVGTVYVSIRDLTEWWVSAISFCVQRGQKLPSKKTIQNIVKSPRGWSDVVFDIRQTFPNARIVVREFEWKKDNPKQQLRQLTKWSIWNETSGIKKAHNSRPTTHAIAMALLERSDFDGLAKLPKQANFQPFMDRHLLELHRRYTLDLIALREANDIEFWAEGELEKRQPLRSPKLLSSDLEDTSNPTTCFLHIGKTGGTFLKSHASRQDVSDQSTFLGKHGDTLTTTIQDFGLQRKLAFFFRDPEKRFVSGFQSRLRCGRPTYNANWTLGEATAFSFFATPNDLAEALSSGDDRLNSAAHFAFSHIFHLKHDYVHYLNSSEAILYEHKMKNIIICCETENIDRHLTRMLGLLEFSPSPEGGVEKNAATASQKPALSATGKANLRDHWSKEFHIYEACKIIARDLGFSDKCTDK